MKEIASLTGVSQTTVSLVLNGNYRKRNISEETARHILAVAQERDYRPNLLARGIRTHRTGIIGLLVSDAAVRQLAQNGAIVQGTCQLEANFLLEGIRIMQECVRSEDVKAGRLPELLTCGLADFFIASPLYGDTEEDGWRYLSNLRKHFSRLILLDDAPADEYAATLPVLSMDNQSAGRKAADYLWSKNCRSFGIIGSGICSHAHSMRKESFCQRIGELSREKAYITYAASGNCWETDCGAQALSKLLQMTQGHLPDAIVCLNDFFACSAEQELLSRHVRIPQDTMLLGFDNSLMASLAPVPISSIGISLNDIMAHLLDIWKSICSSATEDIPSLILPGIIYERASSFKV